MKLPPLAGSLDTIDVPRTQERRYSESFFCSDANKGDLRQANSSLGPVQHPVSRCQWSTFGEDHKGNERLMCNGNGSKFQFTDGKGREETRV